REGLGEAVDGLVFAVEVRGRVVAHVVLVAEGEGVVGPDGIPRPDLGVADARGQRHLVTGGLALAPLIAHADEVRRVGGDLALDERVHSGGVGHHVEAAPLEQLLDDLLGDLLVEPGLRAGVLEERHADALDRGVDDRALADERVAAGGDGQRQGERHRAGPCPHRTTRLTRRPGTTTAFSTCLPSRCSRTLGSSRASRRISASAASRGTVMRPRTLPLTCTASSTASSRAPSASPTGHGCAPRLSVWPSRCHISSATWGVNGLIRRTSVSRVSRQTTRPGPWMTSSSSRPLSLVSSWNAATALLRWKRSSISSVTLRIVWWTLR